MFCVLIVSLSCDVVAVAGQSDADVVQMCRWRLLEKRQQLSFW